MQYIYNYFNWIILFVFLLQHTSSHWTYFQSILEEKIFLNNSAFRQVGKADIKHMILLKEQFMLTFFCKTKKKILCTMSELVHTRKISWIIAYRLLTLLWYFKIISHKILCFFFNLLEFSSVSHHLLCMKILVWKTEAVAFCPRSLFAVLRKRNNPGSECHEVMMTKCSIWSELSL